MWATSLLDELHIDWVGDQSGGHAPGQKRTDRLAPSITVVKRPLVYVHPHKGVGFGAIKASGEAHCVINGYDTMIQCILYTGAKMARNLLLDGPAEVSSDDVAAKRKWQPTLIGPPFAKVYNQLQVPVAKRELTLVNQEAQIHVAGYDGVLNSIKRHRNSGEIGLEEPQREIGARHRARYRDAFSAHT
jgi:hypothetical protein